MPWTAFGITALVISVISRAFLKFDTQLSVREHEKRHWSNKSFDEVLEKLGKENIYWFLEICNGAKRKGVIISALFIWGLAFAALAIGRVYRIEFWKIYGLMVLCCSGVTWLVAACARLWLENSADNYVARFKADGRNMMQIYMKGTKKPFFLLERLTCLMFGLPFVDTAYEPEPKAVKLARYPRFFGYIDGVAMPFMLALLVGGGMYAYSLLF